MVKCTVTFLLTYSNALYSQFITFVLSKFLLLADFQGRDWRITLIVNKLLRQGNKTKSSQEYYETQEQTQNLRDETKLKMYIILYTKTKKT